MNTQKILILVAIAATVLVLSSYAPENTVVLQSHW